MGVFQDETLFDALELALAARMLSPLMPFALPDQVPILFLAPLTCYDLMNPTATNPSMILGSYLSIPGSAKTLRSPYVAIPLSYAIVPLHILQAQAPPPHSPDPTFWNVVERAVEHSVHGATALAWLFSEVAKTTPQKVRSAELSFGRGCLIPWFQDPAPVRDDRRFPSCDSLDLSSLPSIATEDDLLRVDMAELDSIPSSELYIGESELATAKSTALKLVHPV